jgi:hypothetical protein
MVEKEKHIESQDRSEEPQVRVSQVKEKREISLRNSRRILLARRLLLPVLAAALLVAFILVGREFTNRREYLNAMRDLQKHIEAFGKKHQRLPSRREILQLEIGSRIKAEDIWYEEEFIHEDSPIGSPLAYTGFLPLHFFTSGHAVLKKSSATDWEVDWMTSAALKELLTQRNQHHHRVLEKSSGLKIKLP